MEDTGTTKDDVKLPVGEVREKIERLFLTEGKDTGESQSSSCVKCHINVPVVVIVVSAMGQELAMEAKEAPRGE